MRDQIIRNINSRFESFADLAKEVSEELLHESIDNPKHKTLKDHYWCIVGARESFTKALEAGEWAGFSYSLTTINTVEVINKLSTSAQQFNSIIDSIDIWTPEREGFLTSLLEHEVMHEGQIIRHMYALEHTLPASWKWA